MGAILRHICIFNQTIHRWCLLFQITKKFKSLHWLYNNHDGVSNHQDHGCLLNRLFRRRSKKTSNFRVTGLCVGNSLGPVNSPHKGPVTRKMFPFDDVIMSNVRIAAIMMGCTVLCVYVVMATVMLHIKMRWAHIWHTVTFINIEGAFLGIGSLIIKMKLP